MTKAEKLLQWWFELIPRDGVPCDDAVLVMEHLGMTVKTDSQNHKYAFHDTLVGSPEFPMGSFRVNCHAYGKQGVAHPRGIRTIVKAARIIRGEE